MTDEGTDEPVPAAPAGRYDDLPTWEELQDVRMWILAGCPAAYRGIDPREMVRRLWKLMEGLPHHLAIYAWGSEEWKAELARHRGLGLVVDLYREQEEPQP